jgi:hypothetical protein
MRTEPRKTGVETTRIASQIYIKLPSGETILALGYIGARTDWRAGTTLSYISCDLTQQPTRAEIIHQTQHCRGKIDPRDI